MYSYISLLLNCVSNWMWGSRGAPHAGAGAYAIMTSRQPLAARRCRSPPACGAQTALADGALGGSRMVLSGLGVASSAWVQRILEGRPRPSLFREDFPGAQPPVPGALEELRSLLRPVGPVVLPHDLVGVAGRRQGDSRHMVGSSDPRRRCASRRPPTSNMTLSTWPLVSKTPEVGTRRRSRCWSLGRWPACSVTPVSSRGCRAQSAGPRRSAQSRRTLPGVAPRTWPARIRFSGLASRTGATSLLRRPLWFQRPPPGCF